MRVLITGAGGFIGSHLLEDQLKKGSHVTAVDINTEALESIKKNPLLTVFTGDFTDRSFLDPILPGHDICFHLASAHLETGVNDSYFWKVNVDGTRRFVERCHQTGINRFVHCSSVGVFGEVKNPPADENSPCRPDIAYEKSKLAGEMSVLEYSRNSGYALTVIRPAWVYGPRCQRTLKLFRSIKKKRFFFVGNGLGFRHPIYITDMVEGLNIAAMHPNALGQIFIMAGPRAITLQRLVNSIADTVGVTRPSLRLPKSLVWSGVYSMELLCKFIKKKPPFTRRSLKFFSSSGPFDITKAKDVIGFVPSIELTEGLNSTYRWMKERAEMT
jgi:nucleoside-diphosphate-sugar epimerase